MWQFIISGYIPGTNLQIGFELFAHIAAVFALYYLGKQIYKSEKNIQKNQTDSINAKTI